MALKDKFVPMPKHHVMKCCWASHNPPGWSAFISTYLDLGMLLVLTE
jgi:hypothetical protein